MKKKRSAHIKTNLAIATPEQLDRLYQNAAEAYMWLYQKVVERKIKQILHFGRVEPQRD